MLNRIVVCIFETICTFKGPLGKQAKLAELLNIEQSIHIIFNWWFRSTGWCYSGETINGAQDLQMRSGLARNTITLPRRFPFYPFFRYFWRRIEIRSESHPRRIWDFSGLFFDQSLKTCLWPSCFQCASHLCSSLLIGQCKIFKAENISRFVLLILNFRYDVMSKSIVVEVGPMQRRRRPVIN